MKIVVATTTDSFWRPQVAAIAEAMRQQGCPAVVVTPQSLESAAGVSCDVLFCLGTDESVRPILTAIPARRRMLYLLESLPTLTESDEFTRSKWDLYRETIAGFDHVFVHTRRSMPWLRTAGIERVEELIWPHFSSIFKPARHVEQDVDVSFLGTHSPHRCKILDKIGARFRLMADRRVFHEESAELYARAKIVLNIHYTPLRNFECRVSEVLGSGAFLLTEPLEPDDLLLDGQHLAVFDEDNVLDKIAFYLQEHELRAEIARQGHAAIEEYSVDRQVRRVLAAARELLQAEPDRIPADSGTMPPTTTTRFTFDDRPLALVHPQAESIEYMLNEIFVKNSYPILRLLEGITPVIFDIGANIGCASLWYRLHYPDCTIWAFEPDPAAFHCLEANLGELPRVKLFPFGFYSRECDAVLFRGADNSTTSSISASSHNQSSGTTIRLRQLSSFLQQHAVPRISLLKIDTEGAEVAILHDIRGFFDRIDVIQLEYHSERDRREIDQMLAERFTLLTAQADVVHRGTVTYVSQEQVVANSWQRLEIPRPVI